MFEKPLVCLDGSKFAELVLAPIKKQASCFSHVVLLRIVQPPQTAYPLGVPGEPGVPLRTEGGVRRATTEQDKAVKYLRDIAAKLETDGIKAEVEVVLGQPGYAIVSYAQDNGISLIAIGTHGHGGFRKLTIGSTADYVLNHSTVPVLIIRPTEA
jgi:nucleotide-binding universal stress UspA family protein